MPHNCTPQHKVTLSPGIEMNFLRNFPVVSDHFLIISIISGVIRNPKFGHLNFRVTQSSVGDSCITQSVAEREMVCKAFIIIQKADKI